MDSPELPRLEDVDHELARLHVGVGAAELHGSLCGYVSGGGEPGRDDWLARLALEADGTPAREGALDQLFIASRSQLGDPELGFGLLLPDEDAPLAERAEALLSWCRGFLGGFGLGAGAEPPLSPESREALEDLGKIAASRLSYDDPEGDEAALLEVSEFVRVAALLLHGDAARAARAPRLLH